MLIPHWQHHIPVGATSSQSSCCILGNHTLVRWQVCGVNGYCREATRQCLVAGNPGAVQEAGGQVPGSFCASQPGSGQRQSWSQPHANVRAQSLTGSRDGCLAKASQILIMLSDLRCEVQTKQGPSQGVVTLMSSRQLCMMMGSCQKHQQAMCRGSGT